MPYYVPKTNQFFKEILSSDSSTMDFFGIFLIYELYRVVPGHRNWQIESAVWNWAGFHTEGLETRWQRFRQFLNDLWKR